MLEERIKEMRGLLEGLVDREDVTPQELVALSQELDELIVEWQRQYGINRKQPSYK